MGARADTRSVIANDKVRIGSRKIFLRVERRAGPARDRSPDIVPTVEHHAYDSSCNIYIRYACTTIMSLDQICIIFESDYILTRRHAGIRQTGHGTTNKIYMASTHSITRSLLLFLLFLNDGRCSSSTWYPPSSPRSTNTLYSLHWCFLRR